MTGVVVACGVLGLFLFLLLWMVPVRRKVMRRFRSSASLLWWMQGLSLLVAVFALVTVIWFPGDSLMEAVAVGMAVLFLAVGLGALDRLRLLTQTAVNRRVYMMVAAHPGDLVYGAGGTIASLWDCGHNIHGLTVTNGRSGEDVDLLPQRTREWARFLGCNSMTLGNIPVEQAEQDYEMVLDLIGDQIRRHHPDIIITHSPHDSDPVRQAVSQAVMRMSNPRQAVLGLRSESSTVDFRPAQTYDIVDYLDMKNIIVAQYHQEWDRTDVQEAYEVLRQGSGVPLPGCPVDETTTCGATDQPG